MRLMKAFEPIPLPHDAALIIDLGYYRARINASVGFIDGSEQ